MSRFEKDLRVQVPLDVLRATCEQAFLELDLLMDEHGRDTLRSHEKFRFDAYNPVDIEISIKEDGEGSNLHISGNSEGFGPLQDIHVRNKILELLSRIQLDIEYGPPATPLTGSPYLANELELLSRLHAKGVLSDFEFHKAKEKLLRSH
jgi:hypothetical protein